MNKQYRNYEEIDLGILDTHIEAMTAEKLHGKAEIARELAWRDEQIRDLEKKLEPLVTSLWRCRKHGGHGFTVDCRECNE